MKVNQKMRLKEEDLEQDRMITHKDPKVSQIKLLGEFKEEHNQILMIQNLRMKAILVIIKDPEEEVERDEDKTVT